MASAGTRGKGFLKIRIWIAASNSTGDAREAASVNRPALIQTQGTNLGTNPDATQVILL